MELTLSSIYQAENGRRQFDIICTAFDNVVNLWICSQAQDLALTDYVVIMGTQLELSLSLHQMLIDYRSVAKRLRLTPLPPDLPCVLTC